MTSALISNFARIGAVFAAATLSCAAQAAVVLDQESVVTPTPASPLPVVASVGLTSVPGFGLVNLSVAQSFTAGQAGYLDSLQLQISQLRPNGFVTVALYGGDITTSAAAPLYDFQAFHSSLLPTLSSAIAGNLFTMSFRHADLLLSAGQAYSVVVGFDPLPSGIPNPAIGAIIGTGTPPVPGTTPTFTYNQYAGGRLAYFGGGVANASSPTVRIMQGDLGFRSFIDTVAAVPEPSTWAMLIIGFGVVGGAMRRRARVRVAYA